MATTNALDQTRTLVTNLLTAHPNVSAIFSANGPIGDGTAQALLNNHKVVQLTTDGALSDIPSIENGTVSVDAAVDAYADGTLALQYMTKVIQGQSVAPLAYTPSEVVDKTNAAAFLPARGMH